MTAGGSRITFQGEHLDAFAALGAYFTPSESTGLPELYGFVYSRSDNTNSFAHRSIGYKHFIALLISNSAVHTSSSCHSLKRASTSLGKLFVVTFSKQERNDIGSFFLFVNVSVFLFAQDIVDF